MKLLRLFTIIAVIMCICFTAGLGIVNYAVNRVFEEGIAEMLENPASDLVKNSYYKNSSPALVNNVKIDNTLIDVGTSESNDIVDVKEAEDNTEIVLSAPIDQIKQDSASGGQQTAAISKADLQEVNQQGLKQENAEITRIVISKLSSSEISELSAMAAGGIDSEEREKAKKIICSKFTPAEIEYLEGLYNKYLNKTP